MNKLLITLFSLTILGIGFEATAASPSKSSRCVTYNPSDGTYTVDKSGCVNLEGKK